ncbi:MAG: glycosyltransferase family 2 protein [Candidatus Altiarchaeota archaeon]
MGEVYLSVVIPAYNECENIAPVYERLKSSLEDMGRSYELVFVDDGSSDGTFDCLASLHEHDPKVKVIQLKRNYGKTVALDVGFKAASGKLIGMMDADLQVDPAGITSALAKIDGGYDAVVGWRHDRHDSFSKLMFSKAYNTLRSLLFWDGFHDSNCPLQVYRRECILGLELYSDMHRYIPTLLYLKGFRVAEVKVTHMPRMRGKSKYGCGRLVRGLLDLIRLKVQSMNKTKPMLEDNTLKIKTNLL